MTSSYTDSQKAAQKAFLFRTCPNIITAEEFATVLGKWVSGFGGKEMDEVNKMNQMSIYIGRNGQEPAERQDPPWSQFCASYLPKTVEMFIDPPPINNPAIPPGIVEDMILHNAYLSMLVAVQHVPYFLHYFRSTSPIAEPGKKLPSVIAERIISMAPKWDERMLNPKGDFSEPQYHETLADAVQLLGTLCTIFRKSKPLSSDIKSKLLPWMKKWGTRYRGTLLGTVCTRLQSIFRDPEFKLDVKGMRNILKNWDNCAYPGCRATADLKACARCRTVRYCSPEHQKEHWKKEGGAAHKLVCFKTIY
ncbi:hypothetical protein BDZ89DRAFT_1199231 [Hymenopellis radicata]|nr:hypothetical protein BDZ89DRAFT_1199231 [Hymenopellis radicata]